MCGNNLCGIAICIVITCSGYRASDLEVRYRPTPVCDVITFDTVRPNFCAFIAFKKTEPSVRTRWLKPSKTTMGQNQIPDSSMQYHADLSSKGTDIERVFRCVRQRTERSRKKEFRDIEGSSLDTSLATPRGFRISSSFPKLFQSRKPPATASLVLSRNRS